MRRSPAATLFTLTLLGLLTYGATWADEPTPSARGTHASGPKEFPPFAELPGVSDPDIAARWREGLRLEAEDDFLGAARAYEEIVERVPDKSHTYWRIAKSYWLYGSHLAREDTTGRTRYFTLTEQWADRGLAADARCGECCLYKVAGMGGLIRLKGSVLAATQASTIGELLERGITLVNQQPHPEANPELEELYFAAAEFYKSVPEWFWLKWVIGVQGSRRRALDYMRKANAIAGERPSYMVEFGALLLCFGKTENDPAATAEGVETLRKVMALETDDRDDAIDREHARILLAQTDQACGYSRAEWIEHPVAAGERQ